MTVSCLVCKFPGRKKFQEECRGISDKCAGKSQFRERSGYFLQARTAFQEKGEFISGLIGVSFAVHSGKDYKS